MFQCELRNGEIELHGERLPEDEIRGTDPWDAGWFNICKSTDVRYSINRMKDKTYSLI